MNTREAKAVEIADRFRIVESSGKWSVPSQSSPSKKYAVKVLGNEGRCECPDFEMHLKPCKHLLAVRYILAREKNADGSVTVTETITLASGRPIRKIGRTTTQHRRTRRITFRLCFTVSAKESSRLRKTGKGQRRLPLADVIFAATFKVYSTVSGRRFMSDLRESKERGYIERCPTTTASSITLRIQN